MLKDVYCVKHAALMVMVNNDTKKSVINTFLTSYPIKEVTGFGYQLDLREAGVRQPLYVATKIFDEPEDLVAAMLYMGPRGHVMYQAKIDIDNFGKWNYFVFSESDVEIFDYLAEHGHVLDLMRDKELDSD